MTKEQIKITANKYADLFAADESEFYKRQQEDIDTYTNTENIIIIQLANLYYSCKCGLIDRDEAVAEQKKILNIETEEEDG